MCLPFFLFFFATGGRRRSSSRITFAIDGHVTGGLEALRRGENDATRPLDGFQRRRVSPFCLGCAARSPSSALLPLFGEGSPTKIDYRNKSALILTSLLEHLGRDVTCRNPASYGRVLELFGVPNSGRSIGQGHWNAGVSMFASALLLLFCLFCGGRGWGEISFVSHDVTEQEGNIMLTRIRSCPAFCLRRTSQN